MTKQHTSKGVAFATLILFAVSGFLAFLSGVFWYTFLADQSDLIRWGAVSGSVAFSFAGPACAFMAAKRPLAESICLTLAAVILMTADCAQNGMGYQTLGQLANGVTEKQQAHDKAVADLMALPTPDAEGAIRQMSTYEQTRSALKENVALTETALEAANVTRFSDWQVFVAMGFIAFALLLAYRGVGREPAPMPAQSGPRLAASNGQRVTPKMSDKDQKAWEKISAAK